MGRNSLGCRLRWIDSDAASYDETRIKEYLQPLTKFIFFDPPELNLTFGECSQTGGKFTLEIFV